MGEHKYEYETDGNHFNNSHEAAKHIIKGAEDRFPSLNKKTRMLCVEWVELQIVMRHEPEAILYFPEDL